MPGPPANRTWSAHGQPRMTRHLGPESTSVLLGLELPDYVDYTIKFRYRIRPKQMPRLKEFIKLNLTSASFIGCLSFSAELVL